MSGGPQKKGCCAAAVIAPAPDGRSTWRFNHGHLRSKSPSMLAAPCPSVDNSRRIRTAAAAHLDVSTARFVTKTDRPNVLRRRCECDGYCPLMDMGQLAYWAILIVDGHG
eukprot:scaffold15635_cov76-Cyclotella_meneghiniana.AAC.1